MPTYIVDKAPMRRDGKLIEIGGEVSMDAEEAAQYLRTGTLLEKKAARRLDKLRSEAEEAQEAADEAELGRLQAEREARQAAIKASQEAESVQDEREARQAAIKASQEAESVQDEQRRIGRPRK